jgi:hypothetical protein
MLRRPEPHSQGTNMHSRTLFANLHRAVHRTGNDAFVTEGVSLGPDQHPGGQHSTPLLPVLRRDAPRDLPIRGSRIASTHPDVRVAEHRLARLDALSEHDARRCRVPKSVR